MGVVSGITMPFQFGTNWSRYSDAVGDIVSPLLGYEGLTAFFLEAAFLGVLLFGRKLVPPWAHFFASLMVALGTLASTFWILATNSWMQTPAGYEIVDGRFEPKDWLAIVFNPSFPYRLAHVVTAIYITTGFVVVGVAACWLINRRFYAGSAHHAVDDAVAPDRARAATGADRRPARARYAPIPAGQARRDRGDLGRRPAPALGPVRHPRRRGGEEPLRVRDSRRRQPHSHPRRQRRGARPQGLSAGRPPAGRSCRSSASASCWRAGG